MKWWLSVLALAFTACAKVQPPLPKVSCSRACTIQHTVRIDPAFSEEERVKIWDGLHAWTRASGGSVCYRPQGRDPGFSLIVIRGQDAVSLRPFDDGFKEHAAIYHEGVIAVAMGQTNGNLAAVIAHEAGHDLKLEHSADPASIMHKSSMSGLVSGEVPKQDRATFLSLRCNP